MSFSFSHIPIGLGLATAAHIHLCRNNLAHAERQRQRHQDHDSRMQTLSDLVVLTEVIDLLDDTIDSISTKAQRPLQRSRGTLTSKAYRKEKRGKSGINRLNENQLQALVRNGAPPSSIPLELSADNIDLWRKAYRELRLSLERGTEKAARPPPQASTQTYASLKINFAFSSILSVSTLLCHVASAGKLAHLVSQSTATLVRLVGEGNIQKQPPAIPTTITGMMLPLGPALFVSGIHFLTALKALHTLAQLTNHQATHPKHAKRSRLLAASLLARERRLDWLVRQIHSFEQIQAGEKTSEIATTTMTEPWDDGLFAIEPDLSHLNMDAFLSNPTERARVVSMELRATREELAVFMTNMPQ